jgi:hypothetical protein
LEWIKAPDEEHQVDLDGILDELLRHEGRFWKGTADAQKLTDGPNGLAMSQLRQVVTAGCLLGAANENEAMALLQRIPDVPGSIKLAVWLRELSLFHPPVSRV